MRLFIAIVLLLIQLRPLAGAVVCLEQTIGREECAMPEHAQGMTAQGDSSDSVPVACQTTALCSPVSMGIPQTGIRVALVRTQVAFDVGLEPTHRSDPALAPPFHPPRV